MHGANGSIGVKQMAQPERLTSTIHVVVVEICCCSLLYLPAAYYASELFFKNGLTAMGGAFDRPAGERSIANITIAAQATM